MRIKVFGAALFAILSISMSSAVAAPVDLMGVKLGQPIGLKDCAPERVRNCLTFDGEATKQSGGDGFNYYEVTFETAPPFAAFDHFAIAVKDGKVHQVMIITKGLGVQQDVIKQLHEKFGDPKSGYSFDRELGSPRVHAVWDLASARVVYEGANGTDASLGFVSAATWDFVASKSKPAPHL